MQPLYIKVHSADNVAIIVNPEGLTLAELIPQSHKVALQDIDPSEPVRRYGQIIGYANRAIRSGFWVRPEFLDLPAAPPLDQLPLATAVPPTLPPLEGHTFEGYPNTDGSTGTKNILGITTTVQCVAPTVDYAVRRIKTEILPRYPRVDDVVAITHTYGCGVAIDAPGAQIPIQTLRHISLHPNLGGAPLVVSLGCEKLQPQRLFGSDRFPVFDPQPYLIRLQDEQHRGFGDIVAAILTAADKRLAELDRRSRTTCPASSLIVGLQCGGSDAFSGVTCNPAVGLRGRSPGPRRRHRPVFRGDRGPRRRPPPDAALYQSGSRPRPDPRDAMV